MLWRSLCLLVTAAEVCAAAGTMAFIVSMPQPASHTYHVSFRCEGLTSELQDFKMPQWSPGYYGIGDYARYRRYGRAGHADH